MGIYTRAAGLGAEIDRLKTEHEAEIAKLLGEIARLQNENERLSDENERKDLLIVHYIEQIKLAQHRRFGTSSERTEIPDQVSLFNEAEELAGVAVPEAEETERIEYTRKKRKGKRDEFYEGIPVKQVVHDIPEEGVSQN